MMSNNKKMEAKMDSKIDDYREKLICCENCIYNLSCSDYEAGVRYRIMCIGYAPKETSEESKEKKDGSK